MGAFLSSHGPDRLRGRRIRMTAAAFVPTKVTNSRSVATWDNPEYQGGMATTTEQDRESAQIFLLERQGPFSLDQARALLPTIQRITARWHKRAHSLAAKFERATDATLRQQLEDQMQEVFRSWAEQVQRFGCEVKGPWLVDFDTGDGRYWCWKYPEETLDFVHSHDEGFAGRKPITDSHH